jgi:hypothetical protein
MYKLPILTKAEWKSIPIAVSLDELHQRYMERINDLLLDCIEFHPRWVVIRVDLHCPKDRIIPLRAMTCFIESLKAQLTHAMYRKKAAGKRAHDPMLSYVWVREWDRADQPHFHVALLLNRDAYYSIGDYSKLGHHQDYHTMLAGRIIKAWSVALNLRWTEAKNGVTFPERPVSALLLRHHQYNQQLFGVFYRLSYLAKLHSKRRGDGRRNFGMSQLRCI